MKKNFIKAVCGVLAASLLAGLTALPAAAETTPWQLSETDFSVTANRLSTPDGKTFGDDLSLLCDGDTAYAENNFILFDTYVGSMTACEAALEIDLKALVHPEKLVVYGGSTSWGCEPSYNYDVYAAGADHVFSETPVYHFETETTASNRTDTIDLSGLTQSVRYLKIASHKQRYRLAYTEIEVYGTADTAHPTTYTVRYTDAAGRELLPSRTVSAQAYSSVTETAPVIEGYTPFYTSQALELLPDAENELTFFYATSEIPIQSVTTLMPQETKHDWVYSGMGPISAVIDGDDATVFVRNWSAANVCGSIDFTLDGLYTPDTLRLYWGVKGNKYTSTPSSYAVFGSDDGMFYRLLYKTDSAESVNGAREDVVPLENAENIRYLRICVYKSSGNSLTLAEATLYGTAGTTPAKKIFPISATATQEQTEYPVKNVRDNSESTWRAGIWQNGSEGNAEQADAVMNLILPQVTDLKTLNLSLSPHVWDPDHGTYARKVTLSAFEVEVSENGINYRKVCRYDGDAAAITGNGQINQPYGIVVSNFTGDVSGVKYLRLTFKKYSHLALQSVFVTGKDSENGLRTNGVQIRLSTQTTRAGMRFAAQAVKAELGIDGTYDPEASNVQLGMMLLPKKILEKSGFDTIAALFESGKTEEILDIPAQNLYAQDDETVTFAAVLTRIPVDSFEELLCAVPYVKENGKTRFGKQIERSYTDVAQTANFTYPAKEAWAVNTEDFLREIDGKRYFDVSAASKVTPIGKDASRLFPTDAPGYYISEGTFEVNADTMRRVIESPHAGDGAIKWLHFSAETYTRNPDQYDGVLPVSKMEDPLYVQMCVPNESASYMGNAGDTEEKPKGRTNASNLYELTDRYANALPIGAIYANPEKDLPDDAQITLCFGKITLAARTKDSDGWFIGSQINCKPVNIYPLPWQLENDENPVKSYRLPDDKVQWVDDHYEVKLTGADIKGTRFSDERVVSSVLHFWGTFFYFEKGSDVLGILSSYTVWVKEPEWSGCLTADIGADIRGADGYCQQAFTGNNRVITNEPRVVFGHNVGPKAYDTVMDSDTVCKLLGIE